MLIMATPPSRPFIETITSRDLWAGLNQRLLPQNQWFGGMAWLRDDARGGKVEAGPLTANPIATGSLPSQPEPK